MVHGFPRIVHPTRLCEGCMVAKQNHLPFPAQASYRATEPLRVVYADLCGPITPQTVGGNKYFLIFVDDFSRYMWVYLLKSNDEAPTIFKKFKTLAEKESRCELKLLRTDRGEEFVSHQFATLCEEDGIHRHLTAPYTPQQNGVVEWRNRTVLNTRRSLLKTMELPSKMWGEAVRHAVYLLN